MKAKAELEYLALMSQEYIATLPRSAQIAVSEKAQHVINVLVAALTEEPEPETPAEAPIERETTRRRRR